MQIAGNEVVWKWVVRYWLVIAGALLNAPVFVLWINLPNGLSQTEVVALGAAMLPGAVGFALTLVLRWLLLRADADVELAASFGEQLGIALVIMSVLACLGSLVTMVSRFFIGGIILLLLPAGLLAGASSELGKAVADIR